VDLNACRKILVFGGSFDPPHRAHVALPLLAMKAVGADAVAYIPAAQAPHKRDRQQTPGEQRLAMLRLALADVPEAVILTDELDRATPGNSATTSPSYTVDTLEAVHKRLGPQVELRLLIGADQLRIFDTWRSYHRIIELAEPVVLVRPPDSRAALLAALPAGFVAQEWAPRIVDLPPMDISSSDIRRRVAQGLPITGLVAPAVERYIREKGLYRLTG
jgi:nicotinate-nucleotide adenylyltransferase